MTTGGIGLLFILVDIAVIRRVFHITTIHGQLRSRSKAYTIISEVTLFIATTELARCHRKKLLHSLPEHNPSRRKYIAFLHRGKPNNPL